MIDKAKGLQLLGAGLGPVDVGKALGCDPSFVSQWLMEEDFRQQVLVLRIQSLQASTERDKRIDAIEDTLIEKLKDAMPYMVKTREILQAFAVLNGAKRRGAQVTGDLNLTQNIVQITLPETARKTYFPTVNAQGEVVQVGDRVTVTKPLNALLEERLKKRIENTEDVSFQENKDDSHERPEAERATAGASS
jgi:hypothetical protein